MSYPVLLGAIVIRAGVNDAIRITEGATTATATIAAGTYYLRGDGATGDLCPALVTALQGATASLNAYSATVSFNVDPALAHSTLTITRTSGADSFGILWGDALTKFDAPLLGFTTSTAVNASAKVSTQSCAAAWVSNDMAREIEPFSERVVSVPRAVSGRVSGVTRSDRMQSWRLGLAFIDERRTFVARALAVASDALEGFMERFGPGSSFELHEQPTIAAGTTLAALSASTERDECCFSEETLSTYSPTRLGPGVPLYSVDMKLHRKV